jgi:hypothetical protein
MALFSPVVVSLDVIYPSITIYPSVTVCLSVTISSLIIIISDSVKGKQILAYLSIWYGLPYYHKADPASTSGNTLVCSSVGTSSI